MEKHQKKEENLVGSLIAREADYVLYTMAGPEIEVVTTKAYSAQLMVGYVFALSFAYIRETISKEKYRAYLQELSALPDKIGKISFLYNEHQIS